MKSFQEFLTEAPLAEYDPSDVGERKTKTGKPALYKKGERLSSFSSTDRKLVKNPKTKAKLEKVFKAFKHDFRLFFADFAGSNKFHEHGELRPDQIAKGQISYGGSDDKMIEYLQKVGLVGENKKLTDKAKKSISIIYTTNVGDSKVGLTPWILLHRMGHAMNRSSKYPAAFTGQFVENIKFDIYEFLTHNYTPDEDVYKSDKDYERVEKQKNEFLKYLRSKDYLNDKALAPIFEFFKIFGNFNTAKRTAAYEQGQGKRTKAVVKKDRAFEFLYDSFVSFLWYAQNSRDVWEEEEGKTLPFRFKLGKLPTKIKLNGMHLALADEYVGEQAEGYYKNMISNGIRGVDKMFDSMEGNIYIM